MESGLYTSVSEVVRESLRLLFETEEVRERRLDRLRAEIRLGLDELDRGEGIPGERVRAEVGERLGIPPRAVTSPSAPTSTTSSATAIGRRSSAASSRPILASWPS